METFEIGDLVVLTRIQIGYRPTGVVVGIRPMPGGKTYYVVDWSLSKPRWGGYSRSTDSPFSLTKVEDLLKRGESIEAQIILD